MTIQVCNSKHGASKAALLAALQSTPALVEFHDPGIFTGPKGPYFTGEAIAPGERFPVVMDHPRSMRFAQVVRKADGSFRVL